jgi:metallo-beta-lactamase class B
MLRHVRKRRVLLILLALISPLAVFGFMKWREGGINGGQKYAKPFRIAGNLYYVGANDISSFLITGPEGHVLIDGGYPGTPPLGSIAELGFNIRDVKVLLNSETHYDHAGGLAELQKASGAKLWVSEPSAPVIESGGDDPLARDTAKNPVDAFIDPDGYRAYIDSAEAQFRRGVVH